MANTIYLVRHGQVYNPKKIIYGRLHDFALSQEGKNTIKKTAQFLQREKISRIIASPLLRTRQSALIVSQVLDLKDPISSDLLLEVRSSFEGLPMEAIAKIKFDYYFSKNRKDDDETMEDIFKRMKQFVDKTINQDSSKNIIAISHGDPIMILLAGLKGLPFVLDSIRTPEYIQYGEIVKISLEDSSYTTKRIFNPNI